MTKRKLISIVLSLCMLVSLAGCGANAKGSNASNVENKDKPLVWYNRQPSNPETGALDYDAVKFNEKTYYVGTDMHQGAKLQGEMIYSYIEENAVSLDRNGDGIIGYVLAIGDCGHNYSIARTRGIRTALKTAVLNGEEALADPVSLNLDGSSDKVKDGEVEASGKTLKIRELASKEMVTKDGATWDANAAKDAISEWVASFGDQIDLVVSNNDGMAMAMFDGWAYKNHVPAFGYDANGDCVAAMLDGFCGSISQRADVQTYLILRVLRNGLDGVDVNTGISIPDDAGNMLDPSDFYYGEEERTFYALNEAVTKDNYKEFLDPKKIYEPVSYQLSKETHPTKKVFLSIYNGKDDFLSQTFQPLLQQYGYILNLDITFVSGNGHDETSVTRELNPDNYDAFAINMVKTDNADEYIYILSDK